MGNDWERVLDVLAAADEDAWSWMSNSRWYRLVDLMNQHGRLYRVQSEVTNPVEDRTR